jgi:DNA-binding SARP family transcriptional activator
VKYRVLGPVGALEGDVRVDLGGRQQRRLLAVLLSHHGQVVPTGRIIETLWADGRAPNGANRAVLTYVSRLRASVGRERVVTEGNGYVLHVGDDRLDAADFELAVAAANGVAPRGAIELYRHALSLWHGQAFGEFAHEWWALAHTARLEELRVGALERCAEAMLTVGRSESAIADLVALCAEHPRRERPVALLMCALAASGRRSDALLAFEQFRRRMAELTGLAPSIELMSLDRSIALGDAIAV